MENLKQNLKYRVRRGISLIWVALLLIVLVGLTGLGIDTGYVLLTAHQLQNASDAAALAAVRYVREDVQNARDAALSVADSNVAAGQPVLLDENPSNEPGGDIVVGRFDRDAGEFTPTTPEAEQAPNAVKVVARRTADSPGGQVPLFFGDIFGVPGANVARSAIAMIGGGTGAGMIALAECECGIHLTGNVCLTVNDGDIQINSQGGGSGQHAGCGVCTTGNSYEIEGDQINTGGGDVCADNYEGEANTSFGALPDPLAFLEAPPDGPLQSSTRITVQQGDGIVTLDPGYYPEGIEVQGGGELHLNPGIYVFGKPEESCGAQQMPAGLDVRGGGTVVGEEVMLYFKASPQDCPVGLDECIDTGVNAPPFYRGAALEIAANSYITLTPPTEGLYEHVTFFQARNNVRKARIGGGPGLDIQGALYFPVNELELHGTGEGQFGNMVVSQSMSLFGNGCIEINYTGIFESAGDIVFLVR